MSIVPVAIGASIQAGHSVGNKPDSEMLLDVIPFQESKRICGFIEKIIPRVTTIPVVGVQELTTRSKTVKLQ